MSRLAQARQATRRQLKARVAFDGPSGSGKTWTSLEWATVLADGGRILVIDTEHGSASLYSDVFTFEVITWAPPYDPGELADTIRDAGGDGYAVIVVDSLSHFWEGEGGTLDIVDAAAQKARGNTFAGWKAGTPALRHLVDTILACPMHVLATMRAKTEYVLEVDSKGKQAPKKVGMAPVMRAGIEYEFTLVGDLDLDHRVSITKSRCSALADVLVQPGRAGDAARQFLDWLAAGEEAEPAPPTEREVQAAVLELCDGNRQLANQAWREAALPAMRDGLTLDAIRGAVEAWINTPMDVASDPDGPGVAGGVQRPAGDPQQRPAGGPHGVGGSGPSAGPHPEEAA